MPKKPSPQRLAISVVLVHLERALEAFTYVGTKRGTKRGAAIRRARGYVDTAFNSLRELER